MRRDAAVLREVHWRTRPKVWLRHKRCAPGRLLRSRMSVQGCRSRPKHQCHANFTFQSEFFGNFLLKDTYCRSVRHNVGNITWCIDVRGRICTLLRELHKAWDLQGERLAIYNVPVELIHFDETHCVKSAFYVRHLEAREARSAQLRSFI